MCESLPIVRMRPPKSRYRRSSSVLGVRSEPSSVVPFSVHPVFTGILQKFFQALAEQFRLVFFNLNGIQAHMAV